MEKVAIAFVVGGLLCVIAQLVVDLAETNPANVMVLSVSVGAVLSGLGIYGPLAKFAGAGASIPLTGFGHSLVQGMLEDAGLTGLAGILSGGLRATAIGLTTAILFGCLMAVVSNPKG
ncbi:MAG: SpoVA/SpoVAEb family sporulation membrane protein [Bacillota bacterium]|jgi:stage V sporulation protein AE|nr:SpoVA/SpoVAEb family sporulation membrane protein [Bacillota bacterium]